jgi:hypothetical protein
VSAWTAAYSPSARALDVRNGEKTQGERITGKGIAALGAYREAWDSINKNVKVRTHKSFVWYFCGNSKSHRLTYKRLRKYFTSLIRCRDQSWEQARVLQGDFCEPS